MTLQIIAEDEVLTHDGGKLRLRTIALAVPEGDCAYALEVDPGSGWQRRASWRDEATARRMHEGYATALHVGPMHSFWEEWHAAIERGDVIG